MSSGVDYAKSATRRMLGARAGYGAKRITDSRATRCKA